jgi:hypothetical protein
VLEILSNPSTHPKTPHDAISLVMNLPKQMTISAPVLGLTVGTRALLAAGVALLLADKLASERRKAIGWTLAAVGAITTFPLAWEVLGRNCSGARR